MREDIYVWSCMAAALLMVLSAFFGDILWFVISVIAALGFFGLAIRELPETGEE